MGTKEGWTPIAIAKSAWASTRLQEPWAITLEPGDHGNMEIKFHTLAQVIDMAMDAYLDPSPVHTIPAQVDTWMSVLNLAPIGAIDRATKQLPKEYLLQEVTNEQD